MAEDDDRRRLLHLLEIIPKPTQLLLTDMERPGQRMIQGAGNAHPLFGRQATIGPKVPEHDGHQCNEVNPVVVPGIGGLPIVLAVGVAHVEVPIVLPRDKFHLSLDWCY